ncbi:hypothetical protein V490_07432, partial [Pseudogymnoascus sp. VKM F-3557]
TAQINNRSFRTPPQLTHGCRAAAALVWLLIDTEQWSLWDVGLCVVLAVAEDICGSTDD